MKPHIGVAGLALMAATLVACGGGGGGGSFISPPATPTPPTSASASIQLSTSATTPVQLAKIDNGSSALVTFPIVSAKSNATVTLQSKLPSGATQPQARTIAAKSRIPNAIGANVTVLDYLLVSLDTTVAVASTPSFNFTLASPIASGSSAYIAVLDLKNADAGWNIFLGPGTVQGSTVSFASQALVPPLTLTAGDTYVFALVVSGTAITPPPPTIAPNASASYSGTKSVNYAYSYNFDYPDPAPSVTAPPTTLNYSVAANVSIGSSPFPGSSPSATLIDEHVSETDSGNLADSTFTTDSWVALNAGNSGYSLQLYGQTQQQPSSANTPVVSTLYTSPQTLDLLPESNGASWSNKPASSAQYSYASGDSGTRTVANDGTYTDIEQLSSGYGTVTLTENADGSGSMAGPYAGGFIDSVSFSAPSPNPQATPLINVTLAFSAFAQQNYGYPPQQVIADSVWYPYTSGTPISFYNETDTVKANASLPSGCSPNPYGSTANDVKRTITVLDTVIGDMETTTLDSYNVNGFPVCLVTNDVLSYAYDEQGNQPYFIYIGAKLGLETVTTNETLVIQNAPASSSNNAAVRSQAMSQANALVAALQAHQLSSFSRQRAVRTHSFLKAIRGGHH